MIAKYRGLTLDTKQWVKGGFMQTPEAVFIIDYSVVVQKAIDGYPTVYDVVEVSPESVGQFTGLHDSKGKEIYGGLDNKGGDIIKSDDNLIAIVQYEAPSFVYAWNDGKITKDLGENKVNTYTDFEVIGNATEHPSLLKGDGE